MVKRAAFQVRWDFQDRLFIFILAEGPATQDSEPSCGKLGVFNSNSNNKNFSSRFAFLFVLFRLQISKTSLKPSIKLPVVCFQDQWGRKLRHR